MDDRSGTPARSLSPEVRGQLGKLLPMLSSDHDGEGVGAVAAIERVLKGHDRNWHDLALAETASTREPPRPRADDDTSTTMCAEELIDLSGAGT